MSDGCVQGKINYKDGTRALVSLVVALTDKGLLEFLMDRINAIMTLEYPDVTKKARMHMRRRLEEHHMDIWLLVVPKDIAVVLMSIYESLAGSVCSKVLLAKRLLLVMADQQQSLLLQGISWCATVTSLEERYQRQFSVDNGSLKSTVLSLAADLYSKPLEIHNSLYQIVGWTALDKVQDFQYLEFVLRVQQLSRSNQTDVEIHLLIAYIEICQYRLLDIPPKDYKNLSPE
ncbi:unnamed protein product [Umbelopsis ramanniana]